MRSVPFARPTLIAAVELLEQHNQARFNQMVLRLGLEDEISSNVGISVAKKCDLLGRIVVQRAETVLDTLDGRMTLGEAVVRQAALLRNPMRRTRCRRPSHAAWRVTHSYWSGMTMAATLLSERLCQEKFSSPKPMTRCIAP